MTWLVVVPAYFPTCTAVSESVKHNTTIIFCLAEKGPHLFLAEETICLHPRLMSFLLWNNHTTGRWHSSCDGQKKMNKEKTKIHFHIF